MRSLTAKTILAATPLVFLAACSILSSKSNDGPVVSQGTPNPNGANDGQACGVGDDCKSGVCTDNACTAPTDPTTGAPVCGKSLGGDPCDDGQKCQNNDDCKSNGCVQGLCADPTATDGVKDGSETDVDCGGGNGTPACADGLACVGASDCTSGVCTGSVCQVPTSTDGVKNGDESDVDCGGTTTGAAACALGKSCNDHPDCASSACDYNKKCIEDKSCTPHHGGDTCGPAGSPENCCTKLYVSGTTGPRMNKYNITAGRMRQFVERTNGNMRAFATAYTGSWWSHTWDDYLPTKLDNGDIVPDYTGVYQELGPVVHPPGAQGANEGCFINGPGARTYRIPDAVAIRGSQPDVPQQYSQDVLDEKALNCVTAYIVAAFCAWDGGQMPTRVQWNTAWGGSTYPWGNSPPPAGWSTAYDSDATGIPFTPANGDVKRANWLYNYWNPATKVGTDYSLYIAEPGRFPTGNSPGGFADMAASVFNFEELTGNGASAQVNWSKSGSWQGHQVPYPNLTTSASNKYWATGGRCLYP